MMTLSVIFYIWCHNSKHFAILFQIFEVCTQAQNKAMKKCPIIISSCLMKSKYAKVVSDLYNSLKSLTWQGYWRAILKSCPSAPCASRTFCEHFFWWVYWNSYWQDRQNGQTNPTKWSNILKQFVSNSRRIVWVCLTIL